MALTAINLVKGTEATEGRVYSRMFDVQMGTGYPTGGEPLSPKSFGVVSIFGLNVVGGNAASAALLYGFDSVNIKLLAIYPSGGGAASPAALSDPAITTGATAVTSAAANGSGDLTPGRGKEVANNTDLTTITIRVQIYGI